MTIPVTDGKMLVNAAYHSAVVSGIACIGKMITKAPPRKLDFNGYDINIVLLNIVQKTKIASIAMMFGGAIVNALAFFILYYGRRVSV